MRSTVGAELNPATSIFGRVYNVQGGRWVESKVATTY